MLQLTFLISNVISTYQYTVFLSGFHVGYMILHSGNSFSIFCGYLYAVLCMVHEQDFILYYSVDDEFPFECKL